jgi:hypothetical protein
MSDALARPSPMGDVLRLVVAVLGVWRFTHLVVAEDGPWDVIVRLRRWAGSSTWGELMDCFKCLSIWMAVPFAVVVGGTWSRRIALVPAFSAGAILLQEAQYGSSGSLEATILEEDDDGMLRR